jgi:hypothetical protein
MVRMNFQIRQRDTRTTGCIVMLSQAKHLWLFIPALRQKGSEILRFAQNDKVLNEKTRIELFDPGFKSYPADAVQADHPFPSVTGG